MPDYVPNELLSRLVGLQMYSVEFVMDYLQLAFQVAGDEPIHGVPVVSCYTWPVVVLDGTEYREPDLGYGDALRRLIPRVVTGTAEATGLGLRIEFDAGTITLHPRIEDVHVEIAMLSGFEDGAWMVWRPGEDSFEDVRAV